MDDDKPITEQVMETMTTAVEATKEAAVTEEGEESRQEGRQGGDPRYDERHLQRRHGPNRENQDHGVRESRRRFRLAAAIGAPNSICITPTANQVMFVGESTYPGRIFKVSLEGKVLGVIGRSGRELKQFSGAHALACPSENEIYAAETSNWRVQKLILH